MSVCLCAWSVGLLGLKSLILARIPVGCVRESLIVSVTAPVLSHTHAHTQSSVTYHGCADDTALWGCTCGRIEGFLSEDRETTGKRRRSDTVSSFSASYSPIKNYFDHTTFFRSWKVWLCFVYVLLIFYTNKCRNKL